MRRLVVLAAWEALAMTVIGGCGGSSTSGAPDASAGLSPDSSGASGSPERTDGASDGASCVLDAAPLEAFVIDVDGSDTPCESCIVQNCSTQLSGCSSDCTCDPQLLAFVACAADGGSAVACGGPLAESDASTAEALAQCVGGFLAGGTGIGCLVQCGVGRSASDAGALDAAVADASPADAADAANGVTDASAGD